MSKPTASLLNTLSRRSESAQVVIRFAAWWLIGFPAAIMLYAYDLRHRSLDPLDAFKVFAAWGLLWLAYAEHKRANRAEARADALEEKLITLKLDPVAASAPSGTANVLLNRDPDKGTNITAEARRVSPADMMGYIKANEELLTRSEVDQLLKQCTGDAFAPVRARLLTIRQNLPSPTVHF